jgi:hypothetical protein
LDENPNGTQFDNMDGLHCRTGGDGIGRRGLAGLSILMVGRMDDANASPFDILGLFGFSRSAASS